MRSIQTVLFLSILSGALLWERPDPFRVPSALSGPLRRAGIVADPWSNDLSHLRMESWPNGNGPLKSGFDFNPSDYPHLRGYTVKSDHRSSGYRETSSKHYLWLIKGKSDLTIEIEVFTTSNADAQKSLLNRLLSTSFPIAQFLRTGQRYALKLGDVCLIDRDPVLYPPEEWTKFDFVRNNVRVQVYASSDNEVDAFSLAQAIDERIRRSP